MAASSIAVYGIPNCDTVKRARTWLADQGAETTWHDFKKAGVPPERLQDWIDALGWEALVNTRGTTWRGLSEALRGSVHDAPSAQALLLAYPSVIRRPVVEWADGQVTVGFDAASWAERLA